ncbi:MAG: 5-formyltetrahydrofolate cyclo-ligase [Rickettsiales bacterium]|nr:MAG: 5-formyltetrahydrofolate cyclo-ligase [Rickettsiales bacterium]
MMDIKNNIRKKILLERASFKELDYFFKNEEIINNVKIVLNKLYTKKNLVLALYWPLKGEPDLIKLTINSNYIVSLPKMREQDMDFVRYDLGSELVQSFGKKLMQPTSNVKTIPDVVIVPGLAFSLHGYRIGFGYGYYDKYFAKIKNISKIIKIGVCFHEYLYEYLPNEEHDIKMNYIITNQTIIAL